jgi:drug/metabolite transporter (DMT)-like permease
VLLIAVGAGVGLGLANVAFAQTSVEAGLWPVAATKLVAATVLWGYVLATPRESDRPRSRGNVTSTIGTAFFDAGATMSLALALQRGSLVLVSMLGSLFPAVTVVLARFVLRERIGRTQMVGLGLALAAVVMIVGG